MLFRSPTEGIRLSNQARVVLAAFPEVKIATSQVGRPDDGVDTTGFFNTEYFVDLKPKEQWRPAFRQNKEELIGAMNRELSKIPGVVWNFSQPISDNMEEAVSGVKGELAIKEHFKDSVELSLVHDAPPFALAMAARALSKASISDGSSVCSQ